MKLRFVTREPNPAADSQREKYGTEPDWNRDELLGACSRCAVNTGRLLLDGSKRYEPAEDGPPWLCSLDEAAAPLSESIFATLCDACVLELRTWLYG